MEKEKVRILVWLDDMRNPYQGSWLHDYAPEYETKNSVTWVKSYDEFVEQIETNGLPDMIAFDHDLGEDEAIEKVKNGVNKKVARQEKKIAKSGYDAAKWLVDYCLDNKLEMCKWVVQSANPVGVENINGLLINYIKHFE
jgi:hypothetical protein